MKSKGEIQQLAEIKYLNKREEIDKFDLVDIVISAMEEGFQDGYTQCQEDRNHFLSKETLDELFDAHDSDDFIHEYSDKKYTEEDMLKAFEYGKTIEPFDCFEDFINSLNKQD